MSSYCMTAESGGTMSVSRDGVIVASRLTLPEAAELIETLTDEERKKEHDNH